MEYQSSQRKLSAKPSFRFHTIEPSPNLVGDKETLAPHFPRGLGRDARAALTFGQF